MGRDLVALWEDAGGLDQAACEQEGVLVLVQAAVHELDVGHHQQLNERLQYGVPAGSNGPLSILKVFVNLDLSSVPRSPEGWNAVTSCNELLGSGRCYEFTNNLLKTFVVKTNNSYDNLKLSLLAKLVFCCA